MDLLLSAQERGSVRVVRISKSAPNRLNVKYKYELCIESKDNYIQKILTFKFQNTPHIVIARKIGEVQMFKEIKGESKSYFQLVKEWKNSNINRQDHIVSLGLLNNQYLYTCSNEGKLVIRDLVNDDAFGSYKVYLILNPVSDVRLRMAVHDRKRITVASCGKNSELKLYEIDSNEKKECSRISVVQSGNVRTTMDLNVIRPLRRSFTTLNLGSEVISLPSSSGVASYGNTVGSTVGATGGSTQANNRHVSVLTPFWTSSTYAKDFLYHATSLDVISSWMISVCIIDEYVACGTQFGKLLIFSVLDDIYPIETLTLSQFPIVKLHAIDSSYVIFADSMSKVGIVKLSSLKVVSFFDNLRIGPTCSFKFVLPSNVGDRKVNGDILKFDPIYAICTTIDKRLVIYKLFDDNTHELLLEMNMGDMTIPAFSVMGDNDYETFNNIFGEPDTDGIGESILRQHEEPVERKKFKLLPPSRRRIPGAVLMEKCTPSSRGVAAASKRSSKPRLLKDNDAMMNDNLTTVTMK